MQIPLSWLREFCNPDLTDAQVAETLTMGGFEVEEMRTAAPDFEGVVVGEIKEAVQHPDADRLRVCNVDAGGESLLQIVCGAPNARVGIRVPVALVGAELPANASGEPFKIKLSKLRGVQSQGMLCSAKELGIDEDASGLLELEADATIGQNIREHLLLDDCIITLKLTPNLGHALSVYGVARELSALTGAELKGYNNNPVTEKINNVLEVKVQAADLCGRFSGRVVSGVDGKVKTPAWMVERLKRCGQRSVSPLVDISNYVMFEMGQPTHIFDLDCVKGGLTVRWGQKGESLELLNGNTVALDSDVGVIADDERVESLAGIMGGQSTAVGDNTRNIYIEAAFWWPEAIAGRARRFNFSTDAAHRFERGVDPVQTTAAVDRITQLVQEICGGEAGVLDDQILNTPKEREMPLRVARAAKVIGVPLTSLDCEQVFDRLGFAHTTDDEVINIKIPAYRFDITLEEDLIEEVARLVGYEQLPETAPIAPVLPRLRLETRRSSHLLRHQLADLGYLETINFSFVPQDWEESLAGQSKPIALLNPIASHMNVMRSSLLGSLLQVLKYNLDRRIHFVRVFEIGRVFLRDDGVITSSTTVAGVRQPLRVAGLAFSDQEGQTWRRKPKAADFYEVKGDVQALLQSICGGTPKHTGLEFRAPDTKPHPALHPGRSAQVYAEGKSIGWVGELHPVHVQKWGLVAAPVVFELDLDAVLSSALPKAAAISKFQAVERDIAVLVKEAITFADLESACMQASHKGLLRKVVVFDVFRPKNEAKTAAHTGALEAAPNEKSMALRLHIADFEKNLTDSEIEGVVNAIFLQLSTEFDAKPRT